MREPRPDLLNVTAAFMCRRSDAVRAFTSRGVVWGGTWNSLRDHMHFSINGR